MSNRESVPDASEAQAPSQEAVEVGLVIADDETLQGLNRDYRGLDEVTDVLAFSFSQGNSPGEETPFITPPESLFPLGEVVLSYPQAVRQARRHRWTLKEELALLVAHGVLHLLGHDHTEPTGEQAMRAREEAVLSQVFPGAPSLQKRVPTIT